jgi:hypothetical protein
LTRCATSFAYAVVVLLASACGGGPGTAERAEATATTEAAPTSRNIITEGVHDKRVGQPGGFGCGDGPDPVCDVTFTVTAIEQNPPCPGIDPPSGKELMRIEVDAQASPAIRHRQAVRALELSHWAVETADGTLHRDLQLVRDCSPDPWLFVGPLAPGTHPRDSVVVVVPGQVTFLWMDYEKTAYRWPVRPPI